MNFSFLILEFLKQQGNVPVPGFGTFYLKNTNALVDEDGKSILPPGKEVAFKISDSSSDSAFAKFIAQRKNIPLIDAEIEMKKQHDSIAQDRKTQIGSGDRSERIRTYNFPQGRVSDHRINLTLYKLNEVLDGDLDEYIDALNLARQAELMGKN